MRAASWTMKSRVINSHRTLGFRSAAIWRLSAPLLLPLSYVGIFCAYRKDVRRRMKLPPTAGHELTYCNPCKDLSETIIADKESKALY